MAKSNKTDNTEVLSYKIDTTEFDKGMAKVIAALEKVEQREYLGNLQRSIDGISTGLDGVNFSNIEQGIGSLENRFSTLGIVGMSVINSLVQGASTFAQSFVFDRVLRDAINGFQELNLQINSTQTILANTGDRFGTTLEQVNQGLDGLNRYADQTIYNFSEMTQAVGAFTSAGVDLGNSVRAIKGIANMAAYAGAGTQAASSGMYQFSNALSMGYMMLYQWNSLVYSGLGTKQLEQELISSARGLGINIDAILKEYGGSFRYSLEAGWADSKVLMHTIAKYSGEVTKEQLKQMKYTDEEIERILKLGKTATDSATKVISYEKLITSLNEAVGSGWAKTFRTIVGDFEQGKTLFTMISDQLLKVIERSADNRNKLAEQWTYLGGRDIVVKTIEKLLSTYNQLLLVVGGALNQVFPVPTGEKLVKITKTISDFIDKLTPTAKGLDQIGRIVRGFASAIDIPLLFFRSLIRYIKQLISPLLKFNITWKESLISAAEFMTGLRRELIRGDVFFKKFVLWGNNFKLLVDKVKQFLEDMKKIEAVKKIKEIIDALTLKAGIKDPKFIENFVNRAKESFISLFKVFDKSKALDSIGKFITAIIDFGKRVYRFLEPAIIYVVELVKNFAKALGNAMEDLANNFTWDKLMTVLELIGKFFTLKTLIGVVQKLSFAFDAFMALGMGFAKTMGYINNALRQLGIMNDAEVLMSTAIAIGILSASVFMLATLPEDQLARGIAAVSTIYAILAGSLGAMKGVLSSISGFTDLLLLPGVLIATALAITILADALLKFQGVPFGDIVKGFTGLIGVLTILVGFMKIQAKSGVISLASGLGFLALAVSLKILAGSLEAFSKVDYSAIGKAALAVGSLMGIIAILGKSGVIGPQLLILAATLTGIAGSLVLLGLSFKYLGTLDYPVILKGMLNLVNMIGALYVAMAVGSGFTAVGIAKIAALAIVITGLGKAFEYTSKLDPVQLLKVSGAMLLAIGGFAVVTSLLNPSMIQGIGVLALLSAGLAVFAGALSIFKKVDFDAVLKGGIALGIFAAAVIAIGAVITPILPAVAAFAGVLLIMTGSMALFGAGVFLFGRGIKFLAEAMEIYVGTVDKFLETLTRTLPRFGEALVKMLEMLQNTATKYVPTLINIASIIIIALASAIIASAPVVVEAIVVVLSSLLDGLMVLGPKLNALLVTLLSDALTHLDANIGIFTTQWLSIQVKFFNAMAKGVGPVVDAMFNYIIALIRATRKAVDEKGPILRAELTKLAMTIMKFFVEGLYDATDILDTGLEYFAAYVHSETGRKFYEKRDKVMGIGLNFVKGLVAGLTGNPALALLQAGAMALTDYLKKQTNEGLDINSPSEEGKDIGYYYVAGIAKGVDPKVLKEKLELLKTAMIDFMNGAITNDLVLQPVVYPVLDPGAMKLINDTFSNISSVRVGTPSMDKYGNSGQTAQVAYNYTQNITASQPLTTEEIARRTKTLLSTPR